VGIVALLGVFSGCHGRGALIDQDGAARDSELPSSEVGSPDLGDDLGVPSDVARPDADAAREGDAQGGGPEVIAEGSPLLVAADDSYVYWTNRRESGVTVFSWAPITGAEAPRTISSAAGIGHILPISRGPLLAGDSRLRWIDATTGDTLASAERLPYLTDVTYHDGTVYWTGGGYFQGVVYKMPFPGGTPSIVKEGLSRPNSLATDGQWIYVASSGDETVSRVSILDGTTDYLLQPGANPRGIQFSGNTVVWTSDPCGGGPDPNVYCTGDTQVLAANADGSTMRPMLSCGSVMAIDAAYVYGTDCHGHIVSIPLAGGDATILASKTHPLDMAVNSTHVYWTASGGLMRVAKPKAP
jgi:hypothetical protein